jgi:hypothetical protein
MEKVDLLTFYQAMKRVVHPFKDEKLKAGAWLVLDFVRECLENSSVSLPTSVGQISDGGQCSVCSGQITSWRGDANRHSPAHKPLEYIYYACCPCSFGSGMSEAEAGSNIREASGNKFKDEALSDSPEVAVVQRRLKEEHQKQIDELNSKLAESAERELAANRKIQELHGEVDTLAAERVNLYSEIDSLQDELEDQAEDTTKQAGITIPVKIKIEVEQ